MSPPETTRVRLETQLATLPIFIDMLDAEALTQRPPSGKWSIHENMAHLGRYHEVFQARMQRILTEDGPNLGRYRAEDDAAFADWLALLPDDGVKRLHERRVGLINFVDGLNAEQLARKGVHPVLGEMNVVLWLEFFLLHEAHHLYRILWLSKTGE